MAEQNVVRAGYRRIAELLEQAIENETHPVGSLLPSYDLIAAEHQVSKNVARDAVGLLVRKGLVVVAPGIGTEVLRKPSDTPPPRDIPAELDEVAATVQRMSDQIEGQVNPDLADLREQLGLLQEQVRHLYGVVGVTHPQNANPQRKAGGRTARSA